MKRIGAALCGLLLPFAVFAAGGQVQSGRDFGTDSMKEGLFVNPNLIDPSGYINDYEFPYSALPGPARELSVYVKPEKGQVLSVGDKFNLLIGLKVNNQSYFTKNDGNYILFIHNPALLQDAAWKGSLSAVLLKIRISQGPGVTLGIFDPTAREIISIPQSGAIGPALDRIQAGAKAGSNGDILDASFKCMDAIGNTRRTRFLWITDSDLLQGTNAARDREYFDYLISFQSRRNITFSYLGHGEVPDWVVMNSTLKSAGGNTYYADSAAELEEMIWDDYNRFVYPAVENIKVSVSLLPWVTAFSNDFRVEWYPVSGFTPTMAYYPQAATHVLRRLDAGDHRIFMYYLSIYAENRAATDSYFRELVEDRMAPLGFVSVEYFSCSEGKTKYLTYPLEIEYTDDYDSYSQYLDHTVQKFTILQNTAFILKELSQLVNKRSYYTAILLVDSQIKLLEDFLKEKPDSEIEGDIATLQKNRELLMEQARNLNYIR